MRRSALAAERAIASAVVQTSTHRLAAVLEAAAHGAFPAADGTVEVLPPPPGPAMAVVALTSRYFIATAAPEDWIRSRLPEGDLLAPMSPRFLSALGDYLALRDDGIDVLLVAHGLPGTSLLRETTAREHARVTRAHAHREHVRVFTDPTGVATIILGHGLALRNEVAIEVEPTHRGHGLATRTLTEARRLVGADQLLFAQTAPGNAASLRAFLAAGFRPIGSEVLFFTGHRPPA